MFLSVVVNARTECQDLQWQFDAVGRLGEAQALAHISDSDALNRLQPKYFLSPGPLWWAFDWNSAKTQFETCVNPLESVPIPPPDWQPKTGAVLLIDEIDKADTDLPNGLLETLGNSDFSVPYLGQTVRQAEDTPAPLVIITTNEERELPPAFLRRFELKSGGVTRETEADRARLTEGRRRPGPGRFGRGLVLEIVEL